jgi:O-antigen/teichoic acid export membrane protein
LKTLSAWSWSVGASFANLSFGIVTGIFVARLLGPEGRGELAEVVYWAGLVTALGACSISTALTYILARRKGHASTTASAAALSLILAIIAVSAGALLSLPFVDPKLRGLTLAYLCVLVPANFVGLTLIGVDQASFRFLRYNILRVLPSFTYLAGIGILWFFFQANVTTLLAASCAGSVIVCILALINNRHELATLPRLDEMWTLLRTGIQHHTSAFALMLFQNADRFLIILYFTHTDLGLYAVALSLSSAGVGIVSNGTSIVLFPKLAATADAAHRRFQLRNGLGASVVAAVFINLSIAAITPILLPFLFGDRFAGAVPLAILLCLAQIPATFAYVGFIGLRALGDWRAGPNCQLLALAAFLPAAACFTWLFGLAGVALAVILGHLTSAIYVLHRLRSSVGLSVTECLLPEKDWTLSVARRFNLAVTGWWQHV